jgi:hypothetical protein
MPCALHDSFCIESYVVYLRSRPYWYNILDAAPYLIGYAGKRHCIALMHLKYCWKRYHCYFYWKFVHYILFYHWFVTEVQFYIKLLFNWTCGLNSFSKQIFMLRCFHLTLALLFPGTWWMLGGKGISCMSHLIHLEASALQNIIIWVHLFNFLKDYSCSVVVKLIMLNAFIFIARVIILLLVCLIIINLICPQWLNL